MLPLLLSIALTAPTEDQKILDAYKARLQTSTDALQLGIGDVRAGQRVDRIAQIKRQRAILAGLEKGKVVAETFTDLMNTQVGLYTPRVGDVFVITSQDIAFQPSGTLIALKYRRAAWIVDNNRSSMRLNEIRLPAVIDGPFEVGGVYAVTRLDSFGQPTLKQLK